MKTPEQWARGLFERRPCNCAAVEIGAGVQHEPGCGFPEPDDAAVLFAAAVAEAREEERKDAEALAEALTPFSMNADRYAIGDPGTPDEFQVYVSLGDCRKAHTVLAAYREKRKEVKP